MSSEKTKSNWSSQMWKNEVFGAWYANNHVYSNKHDCLNIHVYCVCLRAWHQNQKSIEKGGDRENGPDY